MPGLWYSKNFSKTLVFDEDYLNAVLPLQDAFPPSSYVRYDPNRLANPLYQLIHLLLLKLNQNQFLFSLSILLGLYKLCNNHHLKLVFLIVS